MSDTTNGLADELAARENDPNCTLMTLKAMQERLRTLGYRLDRSGDCRSVARWMSGPRAGKSYPCVSLRPVQVDNGLGFAHVEARRDANFQELQRLRGSVYAKGAGFVYEL